MVRRGDGFWEGVDVVEGSVYVIDGIADRGGDGDEEGDGDGDGDGKGEGEGEGDGDGKGEGDREGEGETDGSRVCEGHVSDAATHGGNGGGDGGGIRDCGGVYVGIGRVRDDDRAFDSGAEGSINVTYGGGGCDTGREESGPRCVGASSPWRPPSPPR